MSLMKYVSLGFVIGSIICADLQAMQTQQSDKNKISILRGEQYQKSAFNELAPTLSIIKAFLGEDFKPNPENLKDNIRAFWGNEKFNPHDYKSGMGKQKIVLDDELVDILYKLIIFEQEENLKGNVVLYHGLNGANLFMYKYFGALFSKLQHKDLGEFVLRGDTLYAFNPDTGEIFNDLREIRKFYNVGEHESGVGDYNKGINISTLHCNISLSVSPTTSTSTVSSVGFFCNAFNASDIDISDLIASALVLKGMPLEFAKACGAEAYEMYKKYFLSKYDSNGGILAISIPKDQIDKYAMQVEVGGRAYDYVLRRDLKQDIEKILGINSMSEIGLSESVYFFKILDAVYSIQYHMQSDKGITIPDSDVQLIQKKMEEYKNNPILGSINTVLNSLKEAENSGLPASEVKKMTHELNLYLHPDMQANIVGTFRHPLSGEEENVFNRSFEQMINSHVETFSKHHYDPIISIMPDKNSEKANYSVDSVPYLISRGYFQKAAEIAKKSPNFHEDREMRKLLVQKVLGAAREDFDEISVFFNDINVPFLSLIDEEDRPLIISCFLNSAKQGCFLNLIKDHKLSEEDFISIMVNSDFSQYEPINFEILTSLMDQYHPGLEILSEIFQKKVDSGRIWEKNIEIFMKYGLSFNPDDKEGKKNLNRWIDLCKNRVGNIDFSSLYYVINFYKLPPETHKEIYKLLLNGAYIPESCMNRGEYSFLKEGCKINIGEFECLISYDELADLSVMYIGEFNFDVLPEVFAKKFGRMYSKELIKDYFEFKHSNGLCYSYYKDNTCAMRIATETPKFHTWLDDFKKVKSLEEAKKLVHELDNLDILFCNLGILDNVVEGTPAEKQSTVNEWMISLLKEYRSIRDEIKSVVKDEHLITEQQFSLEERNNIKSLLQNSPLSLIIATAVHIEDMSCNFALTDRLWKYNCLADPEVGIEYAEEKFYDFVLEEMKLYPGLIKNSWIAADFFENNRIPQYILQDENKLREMFSSMCSRTQEEFASLFVKSDNENLRKLAETVNYPGTTIPMSIAMPILGDKYGLRN